ncbi:Nibrin [Merluccius polli]|uniref:Nibrin n=1 Tax=Merluccius polli TaxID=89951 RepID=A0AA47P4B6_MERPO|nr:Nibrin [Merluccius polli]
MCSDWLVLSARLLVYYVLPSCGQTLTVKDASKYGTFVNNSRLPENQPLILKAGDNVTFGVFHSKFSVDHQKVVVCSSCLDNSEKVLLSDALQLLGGRLVNSWTQDCTHLVMSSVKVTIKTICALLCGRLIVKREYFTEFSKALNQRLPPPQAESFVPEIDEPSLNKEEVDLGSNPERRRLFHRKTFVFFNSKQLKRLSGAVRFGGGESLLLEVGSLPRRLLESPQSCVVDAASGSSQPLQPDSTAGWVDSVKRILHEKGCRLITESEIGLAAIYVSCDKYCNPANAFSESDSVQSIKPKLLACTSQSQNVAIEETVLQASSCNVTAYVVNTESSQGLAMNEAAGMTTVRETPEKSQHRRTNPLGESRPKAQEAGNVSTVANTMSASFNTVENTGSQRQKPGLKLQGGKNGGVLPSLQKTNTGVGMFSQRSSQKQKPPAQSSPQKQATLTNFFQPVNKKRPREEEFSAVELEPKRTVQQSPSTTTTTTTTPAPTTAISSKHMATTQAQSQAGSGLDLFPGPPDAPLADGVSHPSQKGRKRKELERGEEKELERGEEKELEGGEEKADDIDMEELESIMSLEMDEFSKLSSASPAQQAQLVGNRSVDKRKLTSTAAGERSSTSKRPRVDPLEQEVPNPVPSRGLLKLSTNASTTTTTNQSLEAEEHTSIRRRKLLGTADHAADELRPGGGPEEDSADYRSQDALAVKDEDVSVVVDPSEALGSAAHGQPIEMLEKPLKVIKQDTTASEAEGDFPKRLVLVEFKSLMVTAPPRGKPQKVQGPSFTKNFKCFRKVRGSDAEGLPRVIGGCDLLAHNRGNSELDEWLKDAAEEDRRGKREESLGDDLFRKHRLGFVPMSTRAMEILNAFKELFPCSTHFMSG